MTAGSFIWFNNWVIRHNDRKNTATKNPDTPMDGVNTGKCLNCGEARSSTRFVVLYIHKSSQIII